MSLTSPDYLVCINCESPCYTFEWKEGEVLEAFCEACGADLPEEFATEEEHEALTYGSVPSSSGAKEGFMKRFHDRFGSY